MVKKALCAGAIFLVIALVVTAADAVTGKWTMSQEGMGGGPARVSTLDLKADGATLTGSITEPGFGPPGDTPPPPTTTPISNGKVDGNNITFDVTRDFNGNSFTIKYAGAITGSDMKVTVTVNFNGDTRTMDATAKKQ